MRNRQYIKTRLKFWEETEGLFIEDNNAEDSDAEIIDLDAETAVEDSESETVVDEESDFQNDWKDTEEEDLSERNPSRYLIALLRHQPARWELIEIMFTKEEVLLV